MSWQETLLAAIAIIGGFGIVALALLQVSKVAALLRERRFRRLAEEVRTWQQHISTEVAEIRRTVEETERRIREVD